MAQARKSTGIVADTIAAVLVGADIDADDTVPAACPQVLRRRRAAAIVEAHAVDDRCIPAQPEQARTRIAGLRRGVTVPHSTKPKPNFAMASGTCASLSKPAARPTGLRKFRPNASTAKRGSSGAGPGNSEPAARASARVTRWAVSAGSCRSRAAPDRACANGFPLDGTSILLFIIGI